MIRVTNYTGSHPKRGRPRIERKSHLDLGTDELQRKRLMVTGKSATAHLSSTFVGTLYSRKYLSKNQYDTAMIFLKLSWSVRSILQAPGLINVNFTQMQELFGERTGAAITCTLPPLTPEALEEKDAKKLKLYFDIRKALDELGPQCSSLALNVIQHDQTYPKLLQLINGTSDPRNNQELKSLKKGINKIRRVFKALG